MSAREQRGLLGSIVTETLSEYDGGRQVSVYVPLNAPKAIIYAGDGQGLSKWGPLLEPPHRVATMIVGVHGLTDDLARLQEYTPVFDAARFAAHEEFFVKVVPRWVQSRFDVAPGAPLTAVLGYSASAELALALGLGHPDVYGAVIAGSPGAGFKPPQQMSSRLPRVCLFAGTREPFFLENATLWFNGLRAAGADVVLNEEDVSHGANNWRATFPSMVSWAFGEE